MKLTGPYKGSPPSGRAWLPGTLVEEGVLLAASGWLALLPLPVRAQALLDKSLEHCAVVDC